MATLRWRRRGRADEGGEGTTTVAPDPTELPEHPDSADDAASPALDEPDEAGTVNEPDADDTVDTADVDDAPEPAAGDEAETDAADLDDADEADETGPDDGSEEEDDLAESPHPDEEPAGRESRLVRALLGGNSPDDVLAIQLFKAAHAKQAITMALAVAVAAVVSGRPAREAAVVLGTVLLGQAILGLHNDIVDRQRDHAHGLTGKPLAMGRMSAETAWYAIVTAFLALLPLSFLNSIPAASWYLGSVVVGMVGNIVLRTGFFSWWSWAVSFGMLPFFLSYGGWGGEDVGDPPQALMVVLAAALGIGVHFMRAVWGLVADHEDNWTYLPLKLGMKIGATRLLALSTLYVVAVLIGIVVAATQVGLRA